MCSIIHVIVCGQTLNVPLTLYGIYLPFNAHVRVDLFAVISE